MKTIIEMTRELGGFAPTTKFLEAFAELVRADEREAERPWVGLTKEERKECIDWAYDLDGTTFAASLAKMVEYKLKEKNNAV